MTEPLFKVVFSGELLPGFALDTVRENLAKLFKSDLGKIDHLFTGKAVVLKRDLKAADADKYLAALHNAGALVRKEADLAASLSLVATEEHDNQPEAVHAQPTSSIMTCPKCGHEQTKAVECSACGIIIEKFIARQALLPKAEVTVAPEAEARKPETTATPASSPYTPPQASVAENLPEYATLKVFSTNGRIGRLRYMAWSLSLILLLTAGTIVVGVGYAITPAIGYLLGTVAVIAAIVVGVQIGVQRLHDIGWSGWLYLLALVPYLGSVFSLVIMILPGNTGANRYGAPPPENSRAVKILACLWILVPVIGILAAIALPSYQEYLQQASS
ncbi:Uncharacterized membrane protein YhaH, DUF805 family [Pseudomonas pohangensis]|uniref:Uncharacterized membrane protein YhaH, DUF805 family n=1 Tax=Pseudomonas pohangensis TaxID=364197 RepID=A0A1H2DXZ6_9PSED|nr:DUF805 domain-containing protein [Pseudomonas pohangensis]SDT87735.1 Uncharacterized membrane protein YhaH, DUF805 family [Pseudomonas pohangensis]